MRADTTQAGYLPGSWVAIAASGAWLLVDLPPDHGLVQQCWSLLSGAAAIDDVLDVLVSRGLRATPGFALATIRSGTTRTIVRGDAVVTVSVDGRADVEARASTRAVWDDRLFDEDPEILLLACGDAPSSGVELPMSVGVTMASSICVRLGEPTPIPIPLPSLSPAPPPAGGEAIQIEAPHSTNTATVRPPGDDVPQPPADNVEHSVAPEGGPLESQSAEDDDEQSYDHLFGATHRPESSEHLDLRPPPPPPPPVAAPPADRALDVGATAGWLTRSPEDMATLTPPDPAPDSLRAVGGVIDGLPWLASAPPAAPIAGSQPAAWTGNQAAPSVPTELSAPIDEPPGEVERTVNRAALFAQPPADLPLPIVGPTVLAGYCPIGHVSPAHAASCRVCGAQMAPQQGFEVPRPALGVLRLSTGDVVTLDRGVLMGRAPELPSNDAQRPHVLRLASPENDISRNHAEVVLDGWHVYVRDLGSTNGTVVKLPGQPPVRLRNNDLQLLENRTAVTLADEVTFTFEVTE